MNMSACAAFILNFDKIVYTGFHKPRVVLINNYAAWVLFNALPLTAPT